jgi:hypothetical protein
MTTADAYELAAQWHDKQGRLCQQIAADEPRIAEKDRERASVAARHHAASAAGLRNLAVDERRRHLGITYN